MLDPAAKVLDVFNEQVDVHGLRVKSWHSFHIVEEAHDVGQSKQVRQMHVLLLQQGRCGPDAAEISDDLGTALFKHVLKQVDGLILEG